MGEETKEKEEKFSINKTVKGRLPSLPFIEMKNDILGKKYDLSLVFIGDVKMKNLNKIYRKKDKTTNVLSFPLDKKVGEIFINLNQVKRDCKIFGENYKNFVGFLFIHGLLHLKDMKHGSKMESEEQRIRNRFNLV